jgi:uncharacterized protein YdeI (YjbR/CyaY-like superfamily)
MTESNPKVDRYLAEGCMRCELGGTPQCKVHSWTEELKKLRAILLDTELTEDLKWRVPVYTHDNKNIVIMSAFKEYCSLSFFKGALLKDPEGILEKAGENTQSAMLIRFTDVQKIAELEPVIKAYIAESIEVEQAGLKVDFKETSEYAIPDEFQQELDQNPALKAAFEALTPGRQRGYLLHFSSAKQAKTRASRVEKYIPQILDGKGMYD